MKRKNIVVLVVALLVLPLVMAFYSGNKKYERKTVYDTPEKVIETFFKSWNFNKDEVRSNDMYSQEYKDCLSERLRMLHEENGFTAIPDRSSGKVQLKSFELIKDEKVIRDINLQYAYYDSGTKKVISGVNAYYKDFIKDVPEEIRFYRVDYKGENLYATKGEIENFARIYTLIKKDGHWSIDNFGNSANYHILNAS
ncbi:hypothetical protein [Clostridium peptidivorans]|uniref:hypothetical protein n=1 Tax=Clostridium peptidivorans TaxID=100174 RepID=UPI000BE3C9D3|nr:hypothetical protein [Clostridium peptidivorans]